MTAFCSLTVIPWPERTFAYFKYIFLYLYFIFVLLFSAKCSTLHQDNRGNIYLSLHLPQYLLIKSAQKHFYRNHRKWEDRGQQGLLDIKFFSISETPLKNLELFHWVNTYCSTKTAFHLLTKPYVLSITH